MLTAYHQVKGFQEWVDEDVDVGGEKTPRRAVSFTDRDKKG